MKSACCFCALLAALLLPLRAGSQEAKKIKIGYPAIAYNQIHVWVAKDAGLFKRYGLDAELVFFRGGQLATQALVAGDPPRRASRDTTSRSSARRKTPTPIRWSASRASARSSS